MQTLEATGRNAFTGRHMLIVLVGFFAVVIAVNLALAFFASWSWTGLVVKNSYAASQHYNGVIAAQRQQDKLGWQADFSHDAAGLSVTLTGPDGAPLSGFAVTASLSRPTHEGEDRVIAMKETAPGTYAAPAALAAGLWETKLVATAADGRQWRGDYRYVTSKAQ